MKPYSHCADNPLNGHKLTAWRASCIEAVAAELFDFTRSKRTTQERASDYAGEAFALSPNRDDDEWQAVAATIRRAVHLAVEDKARRVR